MIINGMWVADYEDFEPVVELLSKELLSEYEVADGISSMV